MRGEGSRRRPEQLNKKLRKGWCPVASVITWLKMDDAHAAARMVREAGEKLGQADGELVIDFSAVRRIDARQIGALENVANKAGGSGVKIALRGVNVDVYKALKLVKLASRFSFANSETKPASE